MVDEGSFVEGGPPNAPRSDPVMVLGGDGREDAVTDAPVDAGG